MAKARKNTIASELRIIGGDWRGRKLRFRDAEGLRPTGDRVRETLFNWLQMDIRGAACLDLFTGSGALGFEAASRGAELVTLVELNPDTVQTLRSQIAAFNTTHLSVWQGAAMDYLAQNLFAFDIVFVDPPFADELLQPVLDVLLDDQYLNTGAQVYCEYPAEQEPQLPEGWEFTRKKQAGNIVYGLVSRS